MKSCSHATFHLALAYELDAPSLAPTGSTGPNGANVATTYDSYGRVATSKQVNGAITTYTYAYSPTRITATTNGRWTRQTLDGLGRVVKTERGDSGSTKFIADTSYAAAAAAPAGLLRSTTRPYVSGTPVTTVNTYDGAGRVTAVAHAGGTGTTNYLYQGNTAKEKVADYTRC